MTTAGWLAVAVFAVVYALIATDRVDRVAASVGGAVLMLAVGLTGTQEAFFSTDTGIDWRVIVLLIGMMIIVSVLGRTGVFEYLAIWAAKRARGRPYRLMVILVLITATASALLDNVTTVLLVAPVTISVCRQLGAPVVPFLLAEVFAANLGGTATLIGDPPNIIIAARAGLSFNSFLVHLAPLVVVLLGVLLLFCRVLFRSALTYHPERVGPVLAMRERDAIREPRLLLVSGIVLVFVLAGFGLHTVVHLEPAVIALTGGVVLLGVSRLETGSVMRDVEWPTLAFFAGLFVMVGALVDTGVIQVVGTLATDAVGDNLLGASLTLIGGGALMSAFVDNIPSVTAISPIIDQLVAANGGMEQAGMLWWSLALGAGLGSNATVVAAASNVVMVGLAQRAGYPISFWRFTRDGLLLTIVTVALAGVYVWLRYFVLGGAP
ncbi:ArsB/NhaD family transporter [Micromonospora violae]|uniref:SLC13 family permease n=1 Tax=Micromonospora violae TaxID=1278207 RepID=UPI0033C4462D